MSEPVPFIDLGAQRDRLRDRIDKAMAAVLDHGGFIMGPEVAELETALSGFSGAPITITCGSGTDALLLPLLAWGIGPGDAVFVPTFTFAATAEVVALLGATPVFVDIDEATYNLDPAGLEAAIATVARDHRDLTPAAVIPVDLFGLPADYYAIHEVAGAHGLRVLADAAQSFGASFGGESTGVLAGTTATSFFPAKPLGCYGDGGAVFTDDPDLADRMRSLRVHGQGATKYDNVRVGFNGRMDTIQAAILLVKLEVYAEELEARQRVAGRYSEALASHVVVPQVPDGYRSAWAQYTIRVSDRDGVAARLQAAGIPTAVYYPKPLHQQPAYRAHPQSSAGLAVSEQVCDEVLALPMHPYLDQVTQDRIVASLLDALT